MDRDHSSQLRIAIVVPAKKFVCLGGLLWAQRYGPLQVASVVKEAGFFVRIFNEELGVQLPEEELARDYDVIGFSCKSSAISRAEEIARHVKEKAAEAGRRVVTVLGGEHASMCCGTRLSEYFDYVLPGESEEAFVFLLESLKLEGAESERVLKIPPRKRFYTCETFDNVPDLSLVAGYQETISSTSFRHFPTLWALRHKRFPMLSFQATRGCPHKCAFCPTPRYLQGSEYRRRNYESAFNYLKEHIAKSGIRRVIFEDPNAAIPFDKLSHQFFKSLAESPIRMKATALVRAEIYRDRVLLELMKDAGVTNLSIGIESLNEQTRSHFKKNLSQESIVESIDVLHRHGFSITGLFIVGYDTDDEDNLGRIERFILSTGIEKWKVSPLTQVLELPDQFMPAHRFFLWDEFASFGRDVIDYGNGEFVLFFPKNMTPSSLQRGIIRFNLSSSSITNLMRLLMKRKRLTPVIQRIGNNVAQRLIQKQVLASSYLEMIEEIEKSFYLPQNGGLNLREDLLQSRYEAKVNGTPNGH